MRLIAVPLARISPSAHPISTFVAQTASKAAEKAMAEAAKKEGAKSGQPFATRMLNKASAFWVDLGRTDQTSTFDWKRRTYVTGEKLMDRIEYQEWALKGIDPAMGPHLLRGGQDESMREKDDNGIPKVDHIPLLYPSSVLKPESLLENLKNLTDHRTPHHYKRFWYCVVGMPLTIPFALIPVIPNLPFFYLVYRAWSHWKAYKSSKYLSGLIAQNRVHPEKSDKLNTIFAQDPAPTASTGPIIKSQPTAKRDAATTDKRNVEAMSKPTESVNQQQQDDSAVVAPERETIDERLLLVSERIPQLMDAMEFPEWVRADLRRAKLQIEKAIREDKLEELEHEAKDPVPSESTSQEQDKK